MSWKYSVELGEFFKGKNTSETLWRCSLWIHCPEEMFSLRSPSGLRTPLYRSVVLLDPSLTLWSEQMLKARIWPHSPPLVSHPVRLCSGKREPPASVCDPSQQVTVRSPDWKSCSLQLCFPELKHTSRLTQGFASGAIGNQVASQPSTRNNAQN